MHACYKMNDSSAVLFISTPSPWHWLPIYSYGRPAIPTVRLQCLGLIWSELVVMGPTQSTLLACRPVQQSWGHCFTPRHQRWPPLHWTSRHSPFLLCWWSSLYESMLPRCCGHCTTLPWLWPVYYFHIKSALGHPDFRAAPRPDDCWSARFGHPCLQYVQRRPSRWYSKEQHL